MSRSQVRRPTGRVGFGADDAGCTILHVDMDAFYASVSLRGRPELHGTPVIVGGGGGRSVVLSATYEARALGIHSAMPMSRARRLAPQAVVIEPDHRAYAQVSRNVMALFGSITPIVEPLSLDEAFLDVSGALRRLGSADRDRRAHPGARAGRAADHLLRRGGLDQVRRQAGLDPGQARRPARHPRRPGHRLPPPAAGRCALGGGGEDRGAAGPATGCAPSPTSPTPRWPPCSGPSGQAAGTHLHELSWGRDPRSVSPHEPDKSVGNEETFEHDIDDPEIIHAHLLALSDQVAGRLRKAGYVGRTVCLKVRFADFTTITRSRTLSRSTDVGKDIYDTVRSLYDALGLQRVRIRLVGVRMEGISDAEGTPQQLLLGEEDHGRREAEVAVDALRARFGSDAVRPARLVDPP